MNVSVSVDPSSVTDVDAGIAELTAIRNRLAAVGAFEKLTGMEHVGVGQTGSPDEAPAQALGDLWPRLGIKLRRLMQEAARFQDPYSTQELADALGKDMATVKAWRANLGRSLNAVKKNQPISPSFFVDHVQPGGGWKYSVDPVYRDLLLARDLYEPYADGTVPTEDE